MKTTSDFIAHAVALSECSDDPRTKTACVLDLAHSLIGGTNHFPRNVKHTAARMISPEKYKWMEHAERDALYYAARHGCPTEGGTAYLLFSPCTDCARALILSGIRRVIVSRKHNVARISLTWDQSQEDARTMLGEAGVVFLWWNAVQTDSGDYYANAEGVPCDENGVVWAVAA